MDSLSVDGGNCETAHTESNLEIKENQDASIVSCSEKINTGETNSDHQLLCGKNMSPTYKRKLRNSKSISSTDDDIFESPPLKSLPKQKRKASQLTEIDSSESEDFNGFDLKDLEIFDNYSKILRKLLGIHFIFLNYVLCKM